MRTRTPQPRRGFTLVEAIATMAVLSVVSIAASRIIFAAADSYAIGATRAELSVSASTAMERIASELRGIESRVGSPGTPWIDQVTATSITWGNGNVLALSGSEVNLTVEGGTARKLLGDVSAFGIACFDESNQSMSATLAGAACDGVRRIEVTITLAKSGASETIRTRVFPRCAMQGATP